MLHMLLNMDTVKGHSSTAFLMEKDGGYPCAFSPKFSLEPYCNYLVDRKFIANDDKGHWSRLNTGLRPS